MTLDEIKQDAIQDALTIDLNWEQLNDPREAKYFSEALEKGVRMIPDLESLYTKLTSGKSVLMPDEPTALKFDDVEKYTQLVEEELHAAYVIAEVYDKFQKINAIIKLANPLDNP